MLVSSAALAQKPPPAGGGSAGQSPSASAAGANAAGGRIGIGTIGPSTLAADLRIKIEDAAAAGLTAAGADVVSAADLARARTTAALGDCADSVCEQRLAQITYTQYWLRGVCQMETSNYRLHLELVDARSGAVLASRDDTCDICTESDVAETTRVAAQGLKAALARSPVALSSQGQGDTGNGAGASASAVASKGANGGREGSDAGSQKPTWRRVLPWVAFGGAAAAIAGGVVALTFDGKSYGNCMPPGSSHCKGNYTTKALGISLLGLGAALATTGIVILALPSDSGSATGRSSASGIPSTHAAQVILSFGGVAVSGSF